LKKPLPTLSLLPMRAIALVWVAVAAPWPARADVFRVTESGDLVAQTPIGAPAPARPAPAALQPSRGWTPPSPAPSAAVPTGAGTAASSDIAFIGGVAPPASPRRAPPELRPHFQAAAARFGLSESLLNAVAFTESRFRTGAVSPAGARGVMQLMPATARDLGVDPADPVQNVMGGARYLRYLLDRFGNNLELALAGYNAGPGAVQRHNGVPPYRETRSYVRQVISRLADEAAEEGR
jgi:soluble lytic murein transglycosylase-like protein